MARSSRQRNLGGAVALDEAEREQVEEDRQGVGEGKERALRDLLEGANPVDVSEEELRPAIELTGTARLRSPRNEVVERDLSLGVAEAGNARDGRDVEGRRTSRGGRDLVMGEGLETELEIGSHVRDVAHGSLESKARAGPVALDLEWIACGPALHCG